MVLNKFNTKAFFAIVILLCFSFLSSAQKLSFNGYDFVLDSKEYSFSDIRNVLVLDSTGQYLFQKAYMMNSARQDWRTFAIISGVGTGISIAGLIYFNKVDNPYVGIIGEILSAYGLLFWVPATIITGTGFLISSYYRKKRIDNFISEYNKDLTKTSQLKIDFKVSALGFGVIVTF